MSGKWVSRQGVSSESDIRNSLLQSPISIENYKSKHRIFQENCQELSGIGTYLLRISSITRSWEFRKVYVGVTWNILRQIQKFSVCKFPCNSVSGDDVDHSLCCGVGRIRVLMLPIPDPFVATIMVHMHYVINPFFYGNFAGKLLVLCLVYS